MTSRELVVPRVIATGVASINTVSTQYVDFGTPDNVKLAVSALVRPGDRLVAVISASTTGTTNTTSFVVLDADDAAGSIGTPATAVTSGSLAGGVGDQMAVVGIRLQNGRPWIKIGAVRASGTTDTHRITCVLLAVPHNF